MSAPILIGLLALGAGWTLLHAERGKLGEKQDRDPNAGDPIVGGAGDLVKTANTIGLQHGADGQLLQSDGLSVQVMATASEGGTGSGVASPGGHLAGLGVSPVRASDSPTGVPPSTATPPKSIAPAQYFAVARYGSVSGITAKQESQAVEEYGAMTGEVW